MKQLSELEVGTLFVWKDHLYCVKNETVNKNDELLKINCNVVAAYGEKRWIFCKESEISFNPYCDVQPVKIVLENI